MDSRNKGEELSQLARLLFDASARKWYAAASMEIAAGILGAAISLAGLSDDVGLAGAVIGLGLLVLAYVLRLWSENQYDTASTMRRQSVLTEGLGWEIEPVQASRWIQRAGNRVLKRFKFTPRDPDYYTTRQPPSPLKLAEMTMESAFYTRQLYDHIRLWTWLGTGIAAIVSILALFASGFEFTSGDRDNQIVLAISLLLPIILSLDLLGWSLRLGRQVENICEIEKELKRLTKDGQISEVESVRLVYEYNCELATGIPVLTWMINRWHAEIREQWERFIKS